METFLSVHQINILIHVASGSLALLTGLIILFVNKGKNAHRLLGKVFLVLMCITIVTGLVGVLVFGRNTFLLVITILSGYMAFSGYRAVKYKSNKPRFLDIAVVLIAIGSVAYFLYFFKSIGMIWSPVIIYSTVGYLIMMVVYDLTRYLLSTQLYAKLWMHEHILKMISAFSGLLSAFAGTVFSDYQPYSQFLPSVLGTLIAIGFMIAYQTSKQKSILIN
ncbi:hypothetical protein ACFQ3S_11115 [Mucilaginibacter terrae]|uniref:hypothetical protein n=1 Tax=Mucilaginibacter terrae TaxID=1955052 RepID=UPI0036311F02